MTNYSATLGADSGSMTIFFNDGSSRVLDKSHPNFFATLEYLAQTPEDDLDEDHLIGLVDPAVGIGRVMAEHFGERMTFDMRNLYLDGRVLDGPAAKALKDRLHAKDGDWVRFAKFLVNLDANPSRRAQQAVWQWVEKNGLTITEDGRFLGYKAVLENGFSSSAGPNNYVNGVLYKNGESTQVPHEIGSVISKHRADVDDTPGGGCSVGLHVGTLSYARGFAPRLMTVAVDPADVVSAPDSDLEFKIRVCRYEVVSLADQDQFAGTSYDLNDQAVLDVPLTEEESKDLVELTEDEVAAMQTPEPEEVKFDLEDEPDSESSETLVYDEFVVPEKGSGLLGRVVLRDYAEANPTLKADLEARLPNGEFMLGHKAVASKYDAYTTESSVRRYRKDL